MRKRIRRPSPALVLSLLALFVALGGTGYAAVKINGKNIKNGTIAGSKLKSQAVTGAKVKNGAIDAAKVKADSLTGAQIDESLLGTVPRAGAADRATSADRAATAGRATTADHATTADTAAAVSGLKTTVKRVSPSVGPDFDSARAAAPEQVLFEAGALTVYAKCFIVSGGSLYGISFVKTTENGSTLTSEAGPFLYGSPYLNPGTDEMQRYLFVASAGTGSNSATPPGSSGYYAGAPDGTQIEGDVHTGLKHGSPPSGNGPYGMGDLCIFAGSMTRLD